MPPASSLPSRRQAAAAAAAAAFAVGLITTRGWGRRLDDRLFRAVNRDRGRAVDMALAGVTELGSIWASAGAAAVIAAAGRRREAADAFGAAWAMWLVGQGAKRVFRRPRPYQASSGGRLLIDRPRGASWPSSHPAVVLAFLTVAGRDLGLPGAARAGLAGLAGTVGASRVYLGVHYPADVLGGLLLGRAVADGWSEAVSAIILGRPPNSPEPG